MINFILIVAINTVIFFLSRTFFGDSFFAGSLTGCTVFAIQPVIRRYLEGSKEKV